jgi:two-component system KDP operon response regulator KdpE
MPAIQTSPRVLIVDDEAPMRQMLRMGLGNRDFAVNEADRGVAALEAVRRQEVDLLLLDLGLPDVDGFQVIRRIRYAQSTVPIIVLSNRGDEGAKVAALDLGADDYITKPFSIEELLARIRVLQRYRIQSPNDRSVVEVGDLRLNLVSRTATIRGGDMRLSPREYELLHLLACHAGKVLTHRFILREVWGNESDVQYLRIYIRSLRQKIEANPSKPTTIKTVQGVGYCLREGGQVPGDEALFRPDSDSSASVPAISR